MNDVAGDVYIVDDNPRLCRSLEALVESEGFRARSFANGQAFVDAFETAEKQCLVLDLSMRGMDGNAVLRRLRETDRAVPTIVLSAYATVPMTVQLMRMGAVTVLEKPHNADALLGAIHEAMNGAAARPRWNPESRPAKRTDDLSSWASCVARYRLSKRQAQVARMISDSLSNEQIAAKLNIAPDTVKMHVRALFRKLGVHDRVGVVMKLFGRP